MNMKNAQTNQNLINMLRTTNPADAKKQVENIVMSSGISKEQLSQYVKQAESICRTLGIK